MEQCPGEKKMRVYEILQILNLTKEGVALDFGCATVEFTQIIKVGFFSNPPVEGFMIEKVWNFFLVTLGNQLWARMLHCQLFNNHLTH
jgi:hypothetical protein